MKRWRSVILVSALVVASSAMGVGTAGADVSPFTGAWTSVDAVDGSSQTLSIGGGATPRVALYDDGASSCDPSLSVAARGSGNATSVSSTELVVPLNVYCLDGPAYLQGTFEITFTYDPATDTLEDSVIPSTTWHRRGS
jgi:hypothetical protein